MKLTPLMTKAKIIWENVPESLRSEKSVRVCLKCGFDLMTKQMGLAARTAYTEMRRFVPQPAAFRTEPQRPVFVSSGPVSNCPYCEAAKRWIATISAIGIDAHRDIRKVAKEVLAAVKRKPTEYSIVKDTRTPVQVFSDWLDRTSLGLNFDGEMWLRDAAVQYLRRHEPLADFTGLENVSRILLSRRIEKGWEREVNRIFLSPVLYGDVLVVQYLLGRTHLHGALTLEGRFTHFEFFHRLRRLGYLEARGVGTEEPTEFLESAIDKVAEDGDIKPHLIIDRTAFLAQLKVVFDKMKK